MSEENTTDREMSAMAGSNQMTPNERNLIRRYLIWCYKTSKEELDKIDRYFTQLQVDAFILRDLRKKIPCEVPEDSKGFVKLVDGFRDYMKKKEDDVLPKKYQNVARGILNDDYRYLAGRVSAIRKAIKHFLGTKALKEIEQLYEREMAQRILQAREH